MKILKIAFVVTLFIASASLTSCTEQDLNEDDVLVAPVSSKKKSIGGDLHD